MFLKPVLVCTSKSKQYDTYKTDSQGQDSRPEGLPCRNTAIIQFNSVQVLFSSDGVSQCDHIDTFWKLSVFQAPTKQDKGNSSKAPKLH